MKKLLFSLMALGLFISAQAQNSLGAKKKTSIAFRLTAFDFGTAEKVQTSSIGSVLNAKQWGQYASTTKAIGFNYTTQYTDQVDIYSNLDLAVTRSPLTFSNTKLRSNENLMASIKETKGFKNKIHCLSAGTTDAGKITALAYINN